MHIPNNLHLFTFKSELNELFASISMREFARTLINIFVPIYLMNLGYSMQTAFMFFAIHSLTHALASFPGARFAAKHGFKHTILMSSPFLLLYYFCLHMIGHLEIMGISIYLIAVIGGISSGLFYVGYHTDFIRSVKKGSTGKKIGVVKILTHIFHTIGPLVGGFLLSRLNFGWVFLIVILMITLSTFPLFARKDRHEPFEFSLKDMKGMFGMRAAVANIGKGLHSSIQMVAWPVFIYYSILNEGISLLGIITSLGMLFSLATTYVISRIMDKKVNFLNRISSAATSLVWIIKNFIGTTMGVFIIDSAAGVPETTVNMAFDKICYDKARKTRTLEYITIREFLINFSQSMSFVVLALTGLNYIFIIGIIGSLMFMAYKE